MQLDTSIPLQARTPEPVDTLGALSRVMSFRQQQQEQQINQIKLQEVQQAQKFKGALANVLSQTPQANEDGVSVYDIPAITKALASQGFGADADQVVKHLGPINDAFRAERAAKLAVIKRGADGIIASGNDPELALHFLDQLDANKSYPKDQLDQYRAFIQANPRPETVAKITALISGPQKLATAAPGSTIYNTETGSTVSTVPDKADKPTEASLDADAQALLAKQAQGIALTPVEAANLKAYQTRKPPPQTANEWKDVLLDGKPAKVFEDPKTRIVTDLNGTVVTDAASRIKPIPTATQVRIDTAAKAPNMPTWALDDTRPSGPEGNKPDPTIRMTPNGLHQAALTYIATGQMPPTGRGSDAIAVAQREAINSKVGAIAASAGMDVPALRAFYKTNQASLTQQQKAADAVQGFMATADKNAELLKATLKKIPDLGIPVFNKPLRAFTKSVEGDQNLSKFATYLQSVQNEYARIISQPNLSGQLTDSARHEAEALIDPKATVPQIIASIEALQQEGTNRMVSIGEQIQRIQQRMAVNPAAPPTKPGAGAPITVGGFTVEVVK